MVYYLIIIIIISIVSNFVMVVVARRRGGFGIIIITNFIIVSRSVDQAACIALTQWNAAYIVVVTMRGCRGRFNHHHLLHHHLPYLNKPGASIWSIDLLMTHLGHATAESELFSSPSTSSLSPSSSASLNSRAEHGMQSRNWCHHHHHHHHQHHHQHHLPQLRCQPRNEYNNISRHLLARSVAI